jgi:hypothetical protein
VPVKDHIHQVLSIIGCGDGEVAFAARLLAISEARRLSISVSEHAAERPRFWHRRRRQVVVALDGDASEVRKCVKILELAVTLHNQRSRSDETLTVYPQSVGAERMATLLTACC